MTKRLTILVLYDKEGLFDEYVFFLISELRTISERIICVINGEVQAQCQDRLISECDDVIIRENIGFDAGAYKQILLDYLKNEELLQYDELVFCNDTFFGPFVPFKYIFKEMENKVCDYWGVSFDSCSVFSHIQSYFLVFKKEIILNNVIVEFFSKKKESDFASFQNVCISFEIDLYRYLSSMGYKPQAFIGNLEYDIFCNVNLSLKFNFLPVMKKKSFALNRTPLPDLEDGIKYINDRYLYDTKMIVDYVERTYGYSVSGIGIAQSSPRLENDFKNKNISKMDEQYILNFSKNVDRLYIYGVGYYSKALNYILGSKLTNLSGYIVSDGKRDIIEYNGLPVYEKSEIKHSNNEGIIVAMNYKNSYTVKEYLVEHRNVLYLWDDL